MHQSREADILQSYGTPFLLSLGISEQLTSLVWLAGPISGLIAQPIIGICFLLRQNMTNVLTVYLTCLLRRDIRLVDFQVSPSVLDYSGNCCIGHLYIYSRFLSNPCRVFRRSCWSRCRRLG